MHLIADSADLKTRMGPGGALEALLAAREAGKIDHIGITGHRIQALVEGVRRHEVVETVQVPFNMVEDDPLKELIPLCLKRQVGVIAMKPVGGGNLAGPGLIGKSTRASLALRWVLSYPVSSAIPGMRTVAEVEENVPIGSGSLDIPDEEEDMLDVLKADLSARTCRRCDYCMPCPQGIQLSVLLRLKSMVQRIGAESVITPRLVEQVAVAETCVRCETCVGKCPYDLPIPDLLQEEIDWLRTREDYCALEK
jgi:predicted aldo/keto reductase-like oxidoreductase